MSALDRALAPRPERQTSEPAPASLTPLPAPAPARASRAEVARAPSTAAAVPNCSGTLVERLARRLVLGLFARIHSGELTLVEDGKRFVFGERLPARPLAAELHVRSPRFYRQVLRGSLGMAESYVEGEWDCDELVALTQIGALNVGALDRLRRVFAPLLVPLQRSAAWLSRNTPGRSREQIAAHYDLGNQLFAQFLDDTMMYSCAIFESPQTTLEAASLAKLERVCETLALGPDDHVLEIGTGWGGFALYAAEHYGCRVTTTTISAEQLAYASERVRAAGLQDRVTVLSHDYRDLEGQYDKLVSIEMIEAVGWQYFPTFFRRCSELLADDGAMLLQAIVIEDSAYEVEKAGRSFINTHIFPGGCLPSLQLIARMVARVTDFREAQLDDITVHYATTLERWRERFRDAAERLPELGYDERFQRLWELYLSYCEGGFRERRIQDVQLLLAKPGFSLR